MAVGVGRVPRYEGGQPPLSSFSSLLLLSPPSSLLLLFPPLSSSSLLLPLSSSSLLLSPPPLSSSLLLPLSSSSLLLPLSFTIPSCSNDLLMLDTPPHVHGDHTDSSRHDLLTVSPMAGGAVGHTSSKEVRLCRCVVGSVLDCCSFSRRP